MATLAKLAVHLSVDAAELSRGLDRAGRQVGDFGQRLARTGAVLTAGLTLPLAGAGLVALRAAGDLEQAEVAFTTLLGSAEKAGAFLEELRDFAARTPFEFVGLRQASQQLLNAGFAAEKIIPTMTAVGDAVASAGGDPQKMEATIRAMTQIQAKGRVMAEEMMQLNEAGTFSWQALADAIGTSVPEAMRKASAGAISAEQFVAAFIENSATRFGGLMEQQSQTLLGMWSTFKDDVTKVLTDIGTAILPVAKDILTGLQPVLQWAGAMAERFANLDPMLQKVILGFLALLAAIGPILVVLGGLAMALGAILTPVGLVTAAIAVAVGAIVGIGAAIAVWISQNEEARKKLTAAWKEIQEAGQEIWDALQPLIRQMARLWREHGDEVFQTISTVFGQIVAVIEGAAKIISGLVRLMLPIGDLQSKGEAMRSIFDGLKVAVLGTIGELVRMGADAVGDMADQIVATFWSLVEKAKQAAQAIWDGVKDIFTGNINDVLNSVSGFADNFKNALTGNFQALSEGVRQVRDEITLAAEPVVDLAAKAEDLGKKTARTATTLETMTGATKKAASEVRNLIEGLKEQIRSLTMTDRALLAHKLDTDRATAAEREMALELYDTVSALESKRERLTAAAAAQQAHKNAIDDYVRSLRAETAALYEAITGSDRYVEKLQTLSEKIAVNTDLEEAARDALVKSKDALDGVVGSIQKQGEALGENAEVIETWSHDLARIAGEMGGNGFFGRMHSELTELGEAFNTIFGEGAGGLFAKIAGWADSIARLVDAGGTIWKVIQKLGDLFKIDWVDAVASAIAAAFGLLKSFFEWAGTIKFGGRNPGGFGIPGWPGGGLPGNPFGSGGGGNPFFDLASSLASLNLPATMTPGFDMPELMAGRVAPIQIEIRNVTELDGRVVAEGTSEYLIEDWRRKSGVLI